MKYITRIGEKEFLVEIIDEQHVIIDDKPFTIDFQAVSDQPVYSMLIDGQSYEAFVYPGEDSWQIILHGDQYAALVEDERERRLRSAGAGGIIEGVEFHLKAPMPGLVVVIPVFEGQIVNKGDVLVILESMKMQNELRSPRGGTVARVKVKPGDSVEQRQTILSVV